MPKTPPVLPAALLEHLSENFVERLLTMQHRTSDRDQSDDWLAHDNFGDFYAATKHLFVVSFSRPELLQDDVIWRWTGASISGFRTTEVYRISH